MRIITSLLAVAFAAAPLSVSAQPALAAERVTYKRNSDRDLVMTITKPPVLPPEPPARPAARDAAARQQKLDTIARKSGDRRQEKEAKAQSVAPWQSEV